MAPFKSVLGLVEFRLEITLLLFEALNRFEVGNISRVQVGYVRSRCFQHRRQSWLRHERSHLRLTTFGGATKFGEGLLLAQDNVRRRGMNLEIDFKMPTIASWKI